MPSRNVAGIALCLAAAVLWGGMFPVMAGTFARLDPFTFTSLRYLLAGLCFVALVLTVEGRAGLALRGERWGLAGLLGSVGFVGFNFLIFAGQRLAGRQGTLIAAVLIATQPMLGLALAACRQRRLPALVQSVCMGLSFVGVVAVVGGGDLAGSAAAPGTASAVALMLLASLCWVVYTHGVAGFPHWSAYRYSALTCVLGLPGMLAINALLVASGAVAAPTLAAVGQVLPALAYMALPAGAIAVLCWIAGNRALGPANGVLFMNAVPLTTFVIAALQGVVATPLQLAGAGLTCLALVANNLWLRRRVRPAGTSA